MYRDKKSAIIAVYNLYKIRIHDIFQQLSIIKNTVDEDIKYLYQEESLQLLKQTNSRIIFPVSMS